MGYQGPGTAPSGRLAYWANWDGAWYTTIADQGYELSSTVFLPLYPLLLKMGISLGFSSVFVGVTISLLASLVCFWFVFEITATLFDTKAARAAVILLAFFPTSFYLNAVYTESLFLMFAAGSIWSLLVKRNIILAAGFIGLATISRNVGVILLVPFMVEWFRIDEGKSWSSRIFSWRNVASGSLIVTPLAGYLLWLHVRFDNATAVFSQQETWGRTRAAPWNTLGDSFEAAIVGAAHFGTPQLFWIEYGPWSKALDTVNLALLTVAVGALMAGVKRLPAHLTAYSALVLLSGILYPSDLWLLMSVPRHILSAFPLFIAGGVFFSRRNISLGVFTFLAGLCGMTLTSLFVAWRFVA